MAGMQKRIGIIGCGAIGSRVARFVLEELSSYAQLAVLCDEQSQTAQKLASSLGLSDIDIVTSYEDAIQGVDYVVEAASASVSHSIAQKTLEQGKDICVLSVGGLLTHWDFWQGVLKGTEAVSGRIYIPSGALAGLDALSAAGLEQVDSVVLKTTKPLAGLKDAPFWKTMSRSAESVQDKEMIFEGSPLEAMALFPKNINVSALLSFAVGDIARVRVQVWLDPATHSNTHHLEVKGAFGEMFAQTSNVPDPENPKTSYLAALSACALLKRVFMTMKVGT